MKFMKYPEIDNSYQSESISKTIVYHPEIKKAKYILTEKIDGANIQLIFNPNQDIIVAKRSCEINPGENFYNIFEVLKKYEPELSIIQKYVDDKNTSIRIYGELFGTGIMKRIPYFQSIDKQIRFFDAMIEINGEEVFMTVKSFLELLKELKIEYLYVPIIGIVDSLEEALAYDVSTLLTAINKTSKAEGIVIKMYDSLQVSDKQLFMLKKKNEDFKECKNPKDERKIVSDDVLEYRKIFWDYLNENRLLSVISKNGPIESKSSIGNYVRLMMLDAIEDFKKDYPDVFEMDKNDQKIIISPNKELGQMVMKYVQN